MMLVGKECQQEMNGRMGECAMSRGFGACSENQENDWIERKGMIVKVDEEELNRLGAARYLYSSSRQGPRKIHRNIAP
jgi:hypothetical protein